MIFCFTGSVRVFAEDFNLGSYIVTSNGGAKLYESPDSSSRFKTIALKDACLNVLEIEGSFGYTVYDSVYGWVDLGGLKYLSRDPFVTDDEKVLGTKGLRIISPPDKTRYVEGEESADTEGLKVALVFDDEKESLLEVTGYKVSFPSLDTYGEKKVVVYYGGFSAEFDITVVKVPLTNIVLTLPKKTTFIEGEAISFEGLSVAAYYSDGRFGGKGEVLKEGDYTIEGVNEGDATLAPGTYTVTVTYKYPEISASFHIYVTGRTVTELKLTKVPANPTIYKGRSFNKDDFELQATYDNGVTEIVKDFDIEYDNMNLGVFTARIYYMDKYVAFDYTVLDLIETGIELGDTSYVGSFLNSPVNFSKLEVYIVYNSGEKTLTDDYALSHEIDVSVPGKYAVTVTYKTFSAVFEYTVSVRNEPEVGDVDFNGKIDAADARLALRFSSKLETPDLDQLAAADVNLDDDITASDARKILRVSARIDSF